MNEVIDWMWFTTSKGIIGIVKMNDEHKGIVYYISVVDGFMEKMDVMQVVAWGTKFPKEAGDALFPKEKKDE
jgi:translation elongation factor EF-4